MDDFKTLPELRPGESGVIIDIQGGSGLVRHLESLGVRAGKRVTKISAQFWRGPQVIKIDNNIQIALGFGMSRKIYVEVKK
jgi:ferrous iron transport protein A